MKSNEAVFIDLETTGLNPLAEEIIEFGIARVDTSTWEVVEEHAAIVWTPQIQDRIKTDSLDDFIVKMHTKSGLLGELKSFDERGVIPRSYGDAEAAILEIVKAWGAKRLPVWGSSVHFDRKFLEQKMPTLNEFFHYRIVDSSSDMERLKAKYPELWRKIDNDETKYRGESADHRVLEDIRHSIDLERRLDKWVYGPSATNSELVR